MSVDLLGLVLIQADKAVENVVASGGVVWASLVVGEVVFHGADRELLLESVDLVEEKNDAGLNEPPGVTDAVKESQSLLHTVDGLVLEQKLVVLGDSDEE